MDSNSLTNLNDFSKDNVKFYHEQGFLVLEDMFTQDEINALKEETMAIFKGDRGAVEGLLQTDQNLTDEEIIKQYVAIHFPHKISNIILDYVKDKKLAMVLSKIISPNVKCMQSMLFTKAPGKKGQSWHQDEFFIPTRDKSLTGAWIALDKATVENGCLWVIPGSHKQGFIRKRIPYTGNQYGDTDVCDLYPYSEKHDAIPVEVSEGSVVFFNGYLLHSSLQNKTKSKYRRALVNHYMSAESMLPWSLDGRLEPTKDLRDVVMICGEDYYHHKGLKDLVYPFVRPDVIDRIQDG